MNNYPAPWNLQGYGYILLYRFDTNFANKQAPDFLKKKAVPGFGSVGEFQKNMLILILKLYPAG